MSPHDSIAKLLYDCRWTDDSDHGKTFIFQYEAQYEFYREAGKYWFKLPSYGDLGKKFTLCVCARVRVSERERSL